MKEENIMRNVKEDIILSGVGGQGVLSMASIIALAAVKQGCMVRQSEIHGMAQRGGIVQVHLRISDRVIECDLIPKKSASFIISLEPLESLRSLEYLAEDGFIITALEPVLNIVNYPEREYILKHLKSLPQYAALDLEKVRENRMHCPNTILVGVASICLSIAEDRFEEAIHEQFRHKGDKIIRNNIEAFYFGREMKLPVNIN